MLGVERLLPLVGQKYLADSSWKIATPEEHRNVIPAVVDIKNRYCTLESFTENNEMVFGASIELAFERIIVVNFVITKESAISVFPSLLGDLDRLESARSNNKTHHESVVSSNSLADLYENAGSY